MSHYVEPRYRYWDIDHSRFEILRFINKGATGEVVEALDHSTHPPTRVAIKRITRVFFDPRQAQRIYREIRILRQLDHPNILKLLHIAAPTNLDTFDDLYIVFPAYDHDIHMIFTDVGQPLGEIHVRWFLYQLLCALQYVQSAGILHRDIKSSNVLINKKCHLVLADFGLARTVAEEKLRHPSPHTTTTTTTDNNNDTDIPTPPDMNDDEDSIMGMDNTVRSPVDVVMNDSTPTVANGSGTSSNNQGNNNNNNPTTVTATTTTTTNLPPSPEPQEINPDKNLDTPLSPEDVTLYERALRYAREHNTGREMTKHVITRWYRPPELSLYNDGKYTMAIDTWSVGCVFGELLTMLEKGKERKVMFPGSFCAPLTPRPRNMYGRERYDQLQVILDVMGWPSSDQISCLYSDKAREYLNTFERKNTTPYGSNLTSLFPSSTPETVQLLQGLLAFLPEERMQIDQALAHPFFATVRNPSREILYAGEPIAIPFVTATNMRELIIEEIRQYNPLMKKMKGL